jgi:nucleoid-associated protein YgaU
MFDPNSRYYRLETAEYTTPDDRKIAYKRRRFLPQGEMLPLQVEVTVTRDDRLDLITAQTLGEGEQFWQVCDANNAMQPEDLLAEPVQVLRIPVPQPLSQM